VKLSYFEFKPQQNQSSIYKLIQEINTDDKPLNIIQFYNKKIAENYMMKEFLLKIKTTIDINHTIKYTPLFSFFYHELDIISLNTLNNDSSIHFTNSPNVSDFKKMEYEFIGKKKNRQIEPITSGTTPTTYTNSPNFHIKNKTPFIPFMNINSSQPPSVPPSLNNNQSSTTPITQITPITPITQKNINNLGGSVNLIQPNNNNFRIPAIKKTETPNNINKKSI